MKKRLEFILVPAIVAVAFLVAINCQKAVVLPEPNENGVVTAEMWQSIHPEIYESFMANKENSIAFEHIEEYPMIGVLYEGMAFDKYYKTARGHNYSLEDLQASGRPHPLANCLTCKTPDYTALVNRDGVEAYKYDFNETMAKMTENVSCYNCHGNDVSVLEVTHQYAVTALGEDFASVHKAILTCGQCHVEYYFDPETREVVLPYKNIAQMHPDNILAYYNERDFSDYTNPRTKTRQIKVQHPEMETFLSEGSPHKDMYTCATCHMGEKTVNGKKITSHKWTSPLDNPELIANNCSQCHKDLKGFVMAIQEKAEEKTFSVGYKLEDLTNRLAIAVSENALPENELDEIRSLNRTAQFYWDFVFVENSEGAHNSKLTHYCLDKANELAEQALLLL
ncbi:MAG: ammonia-forming cytochrome c nitrite reductase subunit c552 [Treponemataceae bacterium]